jgi:hypothetical protein
VASFEQFAAQQCTVLGVTVSETAKPEKVNVSSAAAGTYTLFIENVGPGDESLSFQVVLTPSVARRRPRRAGGRDARRRSGLAGDRAR